MLGRVVHQLNDIVQHKKVLSWLTKGRTVFIPKDPAKGNTASNFRPITHLPSMRKLLTLMISDKIYEHMAEKSLLPCEKKGAQKKRNKRTTK